MHAKILRPTERAELLSLSLCAGGLKLDPSVRGLPASSESKRSVTSSQYLVTYALVISDSRDDEWVRVRDSRITPDSTEIICGRVWKHNYFSCTFSHWSKILSPWSHEPPRQGAQKDLSTCVEDLEPYRSSATCATHRYVFYAQMFGFLWISLICSLSIDRVDVTMSPEIQ